MKFIDNQVLIFQDRNEYQRCKKTQSRCNIVQDCDEIFIQFDNPPCSGEYNDVLCDNEFAMVNQQTLVANGNFNVDAAGWDFDPPEWTWDAGHMHAEGTTSHPGLTQTLADPLIEDRCYLVIFIISNYISGEITPILGGYSGTPVSGNGIFSQVFIATGSDNDLSFSTASEDNYEFDLDGVAVYDMGDCWCAESGNLTPHGGSGICHIPGAETVVTQVTDPLTAGAFYKVNISIRNMTTGEVRVRMGGATETVSFTSNGDFTDYAAAGGTDSGIWMSADFDGCLMKVGVVEYNRSNTFELIDENDNVVFDFTNEVLYFQDRIILKIKMCALYDSEDNPLPYGCYRLKVEDGCTGDDYISNCINWALSWPETRLITANDWMDGDDSVARYSFGLLWLATLYQINQRVKLDFRRSGQKNSFDADRFSTGYRYKSYVEQGKFWEMIVQKLDETQHDALAVQVQTRDWQVDGVAYYTPDEEYSPLWDRLGINTLADVKITVARREGAIFSENCSR